MQDLLLGQIQQSVEVSLQNMRDRLKSKGQDDWVNCHSLGTPVPSNYEQVQAYLLLKILERLESIDRHLSGHLSPGEC